jgi:hypothetical protein
MNNLVLPLLFFQVWRLLGFHDGDSNSSGLERFTMVSGKIVVVGDENTSLEVRSDGLEQGLVLDAQQVKVGYGGGISPSSLELQRNALIQALVND